MRKVGFFGGSFDPIHNGHINFAIELCEKKKLDEVLFCPTYLSPTKKRHHVTGQHRLKMVEFAIQDIPLFSQSEIELERKGVSYTIDTIRSLLKEGISFHLLLAEDLVSGFYKWKEAEELLQLAPPIIGTRTGIKGPDWRHFSQDMKEILQKAYCEISSMEISSTLVRERLSKKAYCGHLVPAKVLDYINKHRLY